MMQAGAGDTIALVDGIEALAGRYDLILCDVWGVVHNGIAAHPGAVDALSRFRQRGGSVLLLSNAPRPGQAVVPQLDRLGVPRTAYDDIVTSGDLTRAMVIERLGDRLFHLGPERDLPIYEGLRVRFSPAEEADFVVCTGLWNDETDTVEDYRPLLDTFRARSVTMVCANPDIVVERGHQLIPCAGAIAQAYELLGGETFYAGKPHPPVYDLAFARAATIRGEPVERSRVLAIGDAIRTDITGARRVGIDSVFVARGIHTDALGLREGAFDGAAMLDWLNGQDMRPDYAVERLAW